MPRQDDTIQARTELDRLMRGFQISRMLRLAADLGIADSIAADASLNVSDLAAALKVNELALRRVLRALGAAGVFQLAADGTVRHTPMSRLLRTDTPMTLHHAARFWTAPGSWNAWGELDTGMTGGVPHEAAWGIGRFAYLRTHGEEARNYDAMMANFPDNRHAAIAAAYDFSDASVIADIGGGSGETLRHVLARNPATRGVLFDRPDVIESLTSADLADGRIKPAPGSFFESAPPGADRYLIVRVLHNWPDADCHRILANIRATAAPGARLLIGDQILPSDPADGSLTEYLIDMQMMAMFGEARVRTEPEFHALMRDAGFAPRRTIATSSPVSIMEAEAA